MPNTARKSTGANKVTEHRQESKLVSFDQNDRKQLQQIYKTVNFLKDEIKYLKSELECSNLNLAIVKTENAKLKQALNLTNFKLDNLEQYGRRENLRIYNIPESDSNRDDGESQMINVAKALNVRLDQNDIQRAHRLGKKKRNANKPRPIIIRFQSHKKRNEILRAKSALKANDAFKETFISEDLTPLRAKLLHYVKQECDNKFVQCHTISGKIRFKKSAVKEGLSLDENCKDPGTGNWMTVTSPDDLFKLNIDVDFEKLNYDPFRYNISENDSVM